MPCFLAPRGGLNAVKPSCIQLLGIQHAQAIWRETIDWLSQRNESEILERAGIWAPLASPLRSANVMLKFQTSGNPNRDSSLQQAEIKSVLKPPQQLSVQEPNCHPFNSYPELRR